MPLVIENTPFEWHNGIWVKREDLCCPGGPNFSKIRGVERKIISLIAKHGKIPIGVLDTVHSKAGWGVAWICNYLKAECHNFYPLYKQEVGMRPLQEKSVKLGANMWALTAGRSAILYHRAKKILADKTNGKGFMLPNGLKLAETVEATTEELAKFTPRELLSGTWVVSISSGTIAKGVALGLNGRAKLICHMGYSRSHKTCNDYIRGDSNTETELIDEGFEYKDKVEFPCPFPCNSYYDLKAWKWLCQNRDLLKEPIVFWNIGD